MVMEVVVVLVTIGHLNINIVRIVRLASPPTGPTNQTISTVSVHHPPRDPGDLLPHHSYLVCEGLPPVPGGQSSL